MGRVGFLDEGRLEVLALNTIQLAANNEISLTTTSPPYLPSSLIHILHQTLVHSAPILF